MLTKKWQAKGYTVGVLYDSIYPELRDNELNSDSFRENNTLAWFDNIGWEHQIVLWHEGRETEEKDKSSSPVFTRIALMNIGGMRIWSLEEDRDVEIAPDEWASFEKLGEDSTEVALAIDILRHLGESDKADALLEIAKDERLRTTNSYSYGLAVLDINGQDAIVLTYSSSYSASTLEAALSLVYAIGAIQPFSLSHEENYD